MNDRIKNPSFNETDLGTPPRSKTFRQGEDAIPGWTISQGKVRVVPLMSGPKTHQRTATHALQLKSGGESEGVGGIRQEIKTTPGSKITLSWFEALTDDDPRMEQTGAEKYCVTVGPVHGTSVRSSQEERYPPASRKGTDWMKRSIEFTPTQNRTVIEFRAVVLGHLSPLITGITLQDATGHDKGEPSKPAANPEYLVVFQVTSHPDRKLDEDQSIKNLLQNAKKIGLLDPEVVKRAFRDETGKAPAWPGTKAPDEYLICLGMFTFDRSGDLDISSLQQEFTAPNGYEFTGTAEFGYYYRVEGWRNVPRTPLPVMPLGEDRTKLRVNTEKAKELSPPITAPLITQANATMSGRQKYLGYGLHVRPTGTTSGRPPYGQATFGNKKIRLLGAPPSQTAAKPKDDETA